MYADVLTLSTSECDLSGNRAIEDIISYGEVIRGVNVTDILIYRGESGHSDKYTGRMPCETEGRDWGDPSKSQGSPKITSKPLEARGEAWVRFSLNLLKDILILDFQAPEL